MLDPSALRDRYQQFTATARELLADFREVEANFRALDRELRERIAAWSGSKGGLLEEMLGDRDAIADSDQGRSFRAFYDFLLSPQRRAELTELLERVQQPPAIDDSDPRMRRIHYDWLDAGEQTQATVRMLSDQLRRFLDDQAWLENRRAMDLLHSIEATAEAARPRPGAADVRDRRHRAGDRVADGAPALLSVGQAVMRCRSWKVLAGSPPARSFTGATSTPTASRSSIDSGEVSRTPGRC